MLGTSTGIGGRVTANAGEYAAVGDGEVGEGEVGEGVGVGPGPGHPAKAGSDSRAKAKPIQFLGVAI